MPMRAMRSDGIDSIDSPKKRMRPAWAGVKPKTLRTVVVLPMPFRPRRVATSPDATDQFTPNKTWLLP